MEKINLSPYKNRIELLKILYKELMPKNICEVGVHEGKYSRHILNIIPSIEKFYLVDCWRQLDNYNDRCNTIDAVQEKCLQETINNITEWKDKVHILRGLSLEVADKIPDASLDWVYIDARHDYLGCKQDINCYWPKLRNGGILSGHDYHTAQDTKELTPDQDWSICVDGSINEGAVKEAVNEFAKEKNKQVLVSYKEDAWHTWSIIK